MNGRLINGRIIEDKVRSSSNPSKTLSFPFSRQTRCPSRSEASFRQNVTSSTFRLLFTSLPFTAKMNTEQSAEKQTTNEAFLENCIIRVRRPSGIPGLNVPESVLLSSWKTPGNFGGENPINFEIISFHSSY